MKQEAHEQKCNHDRLADTKPMRPTTISPFNTPSSTSWCCTDNFL